MRRLLYGLCVSMLFIGPCVQDAGKLATIGRYGESMNVIGCTWDMTGWTALPKCPYFH